MFIDLADAGSVTMTTFLDSWNDPAGSDKGILVIQGATSSNVFMAFRITGVTSASGYRKIGVEYVAGSRPSNGTACVIGYSRTASFVLG
jgi:hypothetical protein